MSTNSITANNLKDTIINEIDMIEISNTQRVIVHLVEDFESKRRMISLQKWWRPDKNSEWSIGKGFKFNKANSKFIGQLLIAGSELL